MTARAPAASQATPHAEQARAARPEASVWVSASAGSGKTKVLADRVLRLLLTGTQPQRILCLTFTRAAAAEMQNRIRHLLGQWAAETGDGLAERIRALTGEEPDDALLERARGLFAEVLEAPGGINIQTIHSFCQSLLARFPIEAGLAPHFRVMDERVTAEALTVARDSVLGLADGETDLAKAVATVTALVGEGDFAELLGQITRARGRIAQMIEDGGGTGPVSRRVRRLLGVGADDTVEGLIEGFCARTPDRLLVQAVTDLAHSRAEIERHTDLRKARGDMQNAIRILEWIKSPTPSEFDNYALVFLTQSQSIRKQLVSTGVSKALPLLERAMRQEAGVVHGVVMRRRAVRTAVATDALITIADAVLTHYERHKRRHALLDYEDLILAARTLVERAQGWVMYKLDGGIEHVLIDEAQDSNADQWAIVGAVTSEFFAGEGARESRRTVFAVGDEKQSIFGFQGAAPDEFARMQEHFGRRATDAQLEWQDVPLATSFRSVPAVLRAVDAVFTKSPMYGRAGTSHMAAMRAPGTGRAEAARKASAIPVGHVSHREGQSGLVEVWPPVMPPEGGRGSPWSPRTRPETPPTAERLSREIAARVASWISDAEPLPSRGRAVRASDVMILVRRRTEIVTYLMQALKHNGVAVAGADRMVVADQLAVQDLVALAAFALLPEDDLNLAAVLKGPLIGFSEEQLFEACHGREVPLWRVLRELAGRDPAAQRAVELLKEVLERADRTPPFEFFAHILGSLGGRARIVARLGEQAHDSVDEMLALAQIYEEAKTPSLQGFLQWFAHGRAEIKRDLDQGLRDEVRIMTVHGAKGLEAPIVFLADTMQTPVGDRGLLWGTEADGVEGGEIMLWPPRAMDRPPLANLLAEARKQRADEEYRRLLYVAMTRAEDRLYVCGYGTSRKPPENCWHNLVREGLEGIAEPFGFESGERGYTSNWAGDGLRLSDGQRADPDRGGDPRQAASAAEGLPEWAGRPAPAEQSPPRPRAPSHIEDGEPTVRSPLGRDRGRGFQRGNLIHRLLETLPDLEPGARADAARRFLGSPLHGLDADRIEEILAETMAVLEAPEHRELFGPGSRAEVPVAGVVDGIAISGRIDRLVVEPGRVRILDFKTNRPPPRRPEDVAVAYRRQMAAYRKLISAIYQDHTVECAILWTDGPRLMTIDTNLDGPEPAT